LGKAAPTPILKLVAIQISQDIMEIYRQRIELALNSGEIEQRKVQSPYLDIKRSKDGKHTVSLTRTSEAPRKSAAAEEQVEHWFSGLQIPCGWASEPNSIRVFSLCRKI